MKGLALEQAERPLADHESASAHLTRIQALPGVLEARVSPHARGWLLVRVDRGLNEPAAAGLDWDVLQAVLALPPEADKSLALPYVLVLGRDVDLGDPVAPFFHWLANSDPGRDILFEPSGRRVGFACAPKTEDEERNGDPVRSWPPIVAPLPDPNRIKGTAAED
jgi:hypothetical protein